MVVGYIIYHYCVCTVYRFWKLVCTLCHSNKYNFIVKREANPQSCRLLTILKCTPIQVLLYEFIFYWTKKGLQKFLYIGIFALTKI